MARDGFALLKPFAVDMGRVTADDTEGRASVGLVRRLLACPETTAWIAADAFPGAQIPKRALRDVLDGADNEEDSGCRVTVAAHSSKIYVVLELLGGY